MNDLEREDTLRRIAFHERRKDDQSIPRYWRKKSEEMYWHYLDLLTKPVRINKEKATEEKK